MGYTKKSGNFSVQFLKGRSRVSWNFHKLYSYISYTVNHNRFRNLRVGPVNQWKNMTKLGYNSEALAILGAILGMIFPIYIIYSDKQWQ